MSREGHPPEIALSGVWQGQRFRGPLRTIHGRAVEVVHRGTWTHGFGPDFRDAMVLFDGRELRSGSIEVHLRTGAWTAHGHHQDERYDVVVLHVVLLHDGSETRRSDGAMVPVVALEEVLLEPLGGGTPRTTDWGRFGQKICASDLTRREPKRVRAILWGVGVRG